MHSTNDIIRPLTLRFRDPQLEQAYGQYDAEGDMLPPRVLCWVLGAFLFCNPLFWWARGSRAIAFHYAEVGLGLLMMGLGVFANSGLAKRHRQWGSAAGMAVLGIGMTALVWLAEARFQRVMGSAWLVLMMANSILAYGWREKLAVNCVFLGTCIHWSKVSGSFLSEEQSAFIQVLLVTFLVAVACAYANELVRRRRFLAERTAETILHNVLPAAIAGRLRRAAPGDRIVDRSDKAVVLFADIVGFTPFAAEHTADELVDALDGLFARFDVVMAMHGLEKIKTIGDAYMAVAGLPEPRADAAVAAAETALDLLAVVERLTNLGSTPFSLRIGLHIGPVVAGVIGRSRFLYDLWGDTVNIASRLESSSAPGRIQVSAEMARELAGLYELEPRGRIALKGRGEVETFFLVGRVSGEMAAPGAYPAAAA